MNNFKMIQQGTAIFFVALILSACQNIGTKELEALNAKADKLEKQQEILVAENKRVHEQKDELQHLTEELNKQLKDEMANKQALLASLTPESILLTLQQTVLFPSSSYTLTKEGKRVLSKVAKSLANLDNKQLHIIGHSDDRAVMKKWHLQFIDNWDLSARRAAAVARYLIWAHHFDAGKIIISGKAHIAPIASNATKEGQAKNRRIEILIEDSHKEVL